MNSLSLLRNELGRWAPTIWWAALGILFTYEALDTYQQWEHTNSVLTRWVVVPGNGALTVPIGWAGFAAVSFGTAYLSWKKRHVDG